MILLTNEYERCFYVARLRGDPDHYVGLDCPATTDISKAKRFDFETAFDYPEPVDFIPITLRVTTEYTCES